MAGTFRARDVVLSSPALHAPPSSAPQEPRRRRHTEKRRSRQHLLSSSSSAPQNPRRRRRRYTHPIPSSSTETAGRPVSCSLRQACGGSQASGASKPQPRQSNRSRGVSYPDSQPPHHPTHPIIPTAHPWRPSPPSCRRRCRWSAAAAGCTAPPPCSTRSRGQSPTCAAAREKRVLMLFILRTLSSVCHIRRPVANLRDRPRRLSAAA
jgi:hypothetical protein